MSCRLKSSPTLAVIEQTDDGDFVDKGEAAFDEVLSQYGLKQNEAYRYTSVARFGHRPDAVHQRQEEQRYLCNGGEALPRGPA